MSHYDTSGFLTKNGVKFKFQNNFIFSETFKEPLFEFDADNNLVAVNFDGLEIKARTDK